MNFDIAVWVAVLVFVFSVWFYMAAEWGFIEEIEASGFVIRTILRTRRVILWASVSPSVQEFTVCYSCPGSALHDYAHVRRGFCCGIGLSISCSRMKKICFELAKQAEQIESPGQATLIHLHLLRTSGGSSHELLEAATESLYDYSSAHRTVCAPTQRSVIESRKRRVDATPRTSTWALWRAALNG